MINSLKIKNFRMLRDFEVKTLGRINLIVGKNNSGKSTVLEALRILAGNANPSLLEQISIGHDEKCRIRQQESLDEFSEYPFQNFFTGRVFPKKDQEVIYIGESVSDNKNSVEISHIYIGLEQEESREEDGEILFKTKRKIVPKSKVNQITKNDLIQALSVRVGDSKRRGFIYIEEPVIRRSGTSYWQSMEAIPVSYIPTQFISVDDLADIWDNILFSDFSAFVKEGLTIISDDVEDIAFVKSDDNYEDLRLKLDSRVVFKRSCRIKLKGVNRAVPLNSLGDGMLRVLQLTLKIFHAKGGFLLIDEFENGLHYSVQEKIWKLLFDLSNKFDIQVFATTHSWDCIESFAKVAKDQTDISGVLFRVGRSIRTSDQGEVIATVFDADKLFNITQADVEVR